MAHSLQVAAAGCVVAWLQTEQSVEEVNKSAQGHTYGEKVRLIPLKSLNDVGHTAFKPQITGNCITKA